MTDKVPPYCNGMGCPLKKECLRYKPEEEIDKKSELWLAFAPYTPDKGCGLLEPKKPNNFVDVIKKLKDGK